LPVAPFRTGAAMTPSDENVKPPAGTGSPSNTSNGANGVPQFPDPQPIPVPPEIIEWARQEHDEEEIAAGVREIMEGRGVKFDDMIAEIKRAAGIDD
jgi:hypothetical protein